MAVRTARRTSRRDVEQEITDKVLDALERGTVPWSKPWRSVAGSVPTSVATGRPYRGINALLLWIESEQRGYASPYWLTFRQAQERGGSVRKGEHGSLVVFWKRLEVADPESPDPDATKSVFLMRHYTVFNVEQTDGVSLPPRFATETVERDPVDVPDGVADVLRRYVDGPDVRHVAGNRAYYSPTDDVVTVPALDQFDSAERYAGTLFHELTHSTGHASRLDRFATNGEPQHFGTERYAREELVAEMGAAMLSGSVGVDVEIEQTAAYVANWLRALRDDKTLVVRAAQQAQRATDRILGSDPSEQEETA